ATLAQLGAQPDTQVSGRLARWRREKAIMAGQVERDAPVARAHRLDAAPDQLAGGEEHVQIAGPQLLDARREDFSLERAGHERRALDLLDRAEQRIEPAPGPREALPVGEEAGQRGRLDRFHLLAQPRKGP